MPTRQKLDCLFMDIASRISLMSYATRQQVGAVLVKDENVLSIGYNGMPEGFPNSEVEYIEDGLLVTNPLVLHAESNAIAKCASHSNVGTAGATLYVTLSPCRECSKLIIQSRIKRVVYRDTYRDTSAIGHLERAGVEIVHHGEA